MKHLASLHIYFWKYKWRLSLGVVFIILSNYVGVLAPQVTGYVVDEVQRSFNPATIPAEKVFFDPIVNWWIQYFKTMNLDFSKLVMFCGLMLLSIALLRGFFMFLMRQTIIVTSRHIEFDQKNEVYAHYQQLDLQFYKEHSTGDLMSRMSEDVSRVRMFTGPAFMYLVNLTTLIAISLFYMFRKDPQLAAYVLAPLPFLAVGMYYVNAYINKKGEMIQEQLSGITTIAQESYSGIRVIKSYSQEKASLGFFEKESEAYRKSGMALSTVESIYFPAIGLLIGLSTLLTIYIGSIYQLEHRISAGTIAEFVVYINMLTFPVSAIGWVASNTQRAAASQKRLNEFLLTNPTIQDHPLAVQIDSINEISFSEVDFTYPHTGIHSVKGFNFSVSRGQKIALIGKTGCGKSTIAQLLLRMYDPSSGLITINGHQLHEINLHDLRSLISYVPQDVFLFSDSIKHNINFGSGEDNIDKARIAAEQAVILKEIESLSHGFDTMIGERGVTLSGGQKQRISIARALSKENDLLIFDDCLSAVDAKTEHAIADLLNKYLVNKTALIITHRIFPSFSFDQIIVMDEGRIIEHGTHQALVQLGGYYARLLKTQEGDSASS
jgi:ATP-binding cassette subfamily B protein